MVHKPEHKVHSFRGLLGDGGQDEINLERQNVNLAYRIIKFQIMPSWLVYARTDADVIVQIWREDQAPIATGGIVADLTQTDLLGVALWLGEAGYNEMNSIIFDNTLFSRNIFVTATDNDGADSINYYIEIEEVPVTASTLMQIKLGTARKLLGGSMGK